MATPAPANRVGQKGHVLLVDDEVELLSVLGRGLRTRGHEVETASDGRLALELLATKEYDVVVSDISMPEMDGITLLRAVRERSLDLPVVLMTGSPSLETAIRAVELGALRYLQKPFRVEELEGVVEYAVRLHRLAAVKREAMMLLGNTTRFSGDLAGLDAVFTSALGSLWMAFQPIVSWSGKSVFGYEALVRCPHPQIPHPGALLEAAERLERIHELGRVIRGRVAADAAAAPGIDNIFVNLHSHDLLDEELFSPDAPLSRIAKRVVLEITERASLDEVKDLRTRTTRLRALGFRLAVDDLGAGYAGLTSFAQLEPEVVKLDMSLVRNVHLEPTKKKLITRMAQLCGDLGMTVLAEGVETREERDVLTEIGCDLLQGYLFGKPVKGFSSVTF
jgi:EAL domain-containing protein (putative c-di-GMP-specific phosphodiesterase class I)/ActR/RegA family two-component response regulator